jgi:chemotaxis protein CheD
MNHVISIAMGDMKIGQAPAVLETVGVGSCLAVVIFDPVAQIGGMTHAILPSKTDNIPAAVKLRYVHESVEELIFALEEAGARRDRLVAKLIGGAHMFAIFGDAEHGIGAKNVDQGREVLRRAGIPIVAEETGGTVGRNVRFDLASGICSVETHM